MNLPGIKWRLLQRLILLLILLVALLRFVNLGTKPYWYDEVITSLRISGYTTTDVYEFSRSGQKTFGSIKFFQCVNQDRNLEDTFNSLITDSSHPPLYFGLLYYWIKFTGCSVSNIRLFSAGVSLLIIPLSYALALEIFSSSAIALLATTLMANSPVLLIYAQEARSYSLLIVLSLLSSLILFRIQNKRKTFDVCCYTLVSAAGLYCHTLYYLVIIAQGVFCLFYSSPHQQEVLFDSWLKRMKYHCRRNQQIFMSLLISWVLFLPWLVKVIHQNGFTVRVGADGSWKEFSIDTLWQRIILNFSNLIYDFDNPLKTAIFTKPPINSSLLNLGWENIIVVVFAVVVILFSLLYTLRKNYFNRLILLFLLATPSLLFLFKDLVVGGSLSMVIRYQLLTTCCIYFSLAYCFVDCFKKNKNKTLVRNGIIGLITVVLLLQTYSNWGYLTAPTWWSKPKDYQIKEYAAVVNQSPSPIVLVEASPRAMINLIKLTHVLNPSTPFRLVANEDLSKMLRQNPKAFPEPSTVE
ncbi:MAG: glycosyltransferase family 39 protein [Thermosynechococcaceae cyanobacterium]